MAIANDFSNILEVPPTLLSKAVGQLERRQIAQVTISDLSTDPKRAHGLYVIFGPAGECFYIGKATSKSFIDRIPEHFDPRKEAWMNTFPKTIAKKDDRPYAAALAESLSCSISLLSMDKGTLKLANRFEAALRYLLKPRYNALEKKPKWLDETKSLAQLMLS